MDSNSKSVFDIEVTRAKEYPIANIRKPDNQLLDGDRGILNKLKYYLLIR